MVGKICRNFGLTKTKMMITMMMPLWLRNINMKTWEFSPLTKENHLNPTHDFQVLHSLQLTARTWKWMVGRWWNFFLGKNPFQVLLLFVLGSVCSNLRGVYWCHDDPIVYPYSHVGGLSSRHVAQAWPSATRLQREYPRNLEVENS